MKRNLVEPDGGASGAFDVLERFSHHRKTGEAEDVHFEQAHLGEGGAFKSGHHGVLVLGGALQRHHVFQRRAADDHPAGVGADRAHAALDLFGRLNQLLKVRLRVVDLLQFGNALDRLGNRRADRQARNELGNAVNLGEGNAEHAAHIA